MSFRLGQISSMGDFKLAESWQVSKTDCFWPGEFQLWHVDVVAEERLGPHGSCSVLVGLEGQCPVLKPNKFWGINEWQSQRKLVWKVLYGMTVEGMTSGCSAHLSFLRHCWPCETGGQRVSVGEVSLLALGNPYAGRESTQMLLV